MGMISIPEITLDLVMGEMTRSKAAKVTIVIVAITMTFSLVAKVLRTAEMIR